MEEKEIQALVLNEFDDAVNLRPLNGFKMNFSANPGFKKVFFSASCDCGTAALLSLEVSETKTDDEITDALPSLVQRIEMQEKSFRKMDCSMHSMMRTGFTPDNVS
ncbi:MAG TPA: hypothetical protein QF838_09255 [SAR202 cluster bacterium]|jgi:hypothetical protein|nr:hypothetical protein [SAR202 cluster bacterium]|tara:strand:+ start:15946 stop:16263 length:318 start_codon:yes stop_codon:yes gene_type:complete